MGGEEVSDLVRDLAYALVRLQNAVSELERNVSALRLAWIIAIAVLAATLALAIFALR